LERLERGTSRELERIGRNLVAKLRFDPCARFGNGRRGNRQLETTATYRRQQSRGLRRHEHEKTLRRRFLQRLQQTVRRFRSHLVRGLDDRDLVPLPIARLAQSFAQRAHLVDGNLLLAFLGRSEEHTSELQSRENLVCRLLLEKKKYRITLDWPSNTTARTL